VENLGLMAARGLYYAFSHRAIQEYLAAVYLSAREAGDIQRFWETVAVRRPDRWGDVARLLFCRIG